MESMTTEGYEEEVDPRLVEASAELREAAIDVNRASVRYLAAIAGRIAVLEEIRGRSHNSQET